MDSALPDRGVNQLQMIERHRDVPTRNEEDVSSTREQPKVIRMTKGANG